MCFAEASFVLRLPSRRRYNHPNCPELSRLGSFEGTLWGTLTVKPIPVPLQGLQQKVYLDPIDFEQPHQPKQPLWNRPFR